MSMYKNIFVTEEVNASGENVITINGEINLYGEGAFATLNDAIAAVAANEQYAVIRVQSGKYDSFVVATDGVTSTPAKVVAVDFDGGEAEINGETVTVAQGKFSAEDQANVISALNNVSAGEGTVFVNAADNFSTAETLYIGVGGTGVAADGNNAIIYAQDVNEFGTALDEMYATAAIATTTVTSGQNVSLDAKPGNAYVVKDGAIVRNEQSKLDIVNNFTVNAGGTFLAQRKPSPYTDAPTTVHVKAEGWMADLGLKTTTLKLDGTADNKAVLDFLTEIEGRQDASLAILYTGKLVANHAEISVADLGFTGDATMKNCTVNVDGVVAFGKTQDGLLFSYEQSMTNTVMNVRGHNRHNENTYFSTEGILLHKLTMTNSQIIVNDGVDGTVSEIVKIQKLTMNSGSSVTTEGAMQVNGALTMDSSCTLTADSLTFGNSGKIEINLLDGFTGGTLIDITGANGLTEAMLDKITLKGDGSANFEKVIKDGDIFVTYKSVDLDFTQNDKNTIENDVVANNIDLTNSKELAVTGKIEAMGTATIENKGAASEDAAQGVLNGGYDESGEEKAAEISAEKIVFQNDGHANVELDAKNIVIANNSKNTLIGTIGTAETENVVIAAGTATADGVTVTGNGTVDGAIKDATITAKQVEIAGQEVTGTTAINGWALVNGNTNFGNNDTTADTVTTNGNVKVVNGATLTVEKDAVWNSNGTYLLVGDTNYGYDFLDFGGSQPNAGGNLVVNGTLNAKDYLNATANGKISIGETGTINAVMVNVEHGGSAGTGEIEVAGTLNATSLDVRNSGSAEISGKYLATLGGNSNGGLRVRDNGTVTVTGNVGINKYISNFDNYRAATIESTGKLVVDGGSVNYVIDAVHKNGKEITTDFVNAGTVEVKNNGVFAVENVTNTGLISIGNSTFSAAGVANDGKIVITDDSTLNAAITGTGFVQVVEGDVTINKTLENKQLIVGEAGGVSVFPAADAQVSAAESTGATVTIKADTNVNAAWVGNAHNTLETAADNSDDFKLTVDGANFHTGYIKVHNTGKFVVTNKADVYVGEFLVRNNVLIEGGSEVRNAYVTIYGEDGLTSTVTIDKSTFASGRISVGHSSDASRKGAMVISDATVQLTETDAWTVNSSGSVTASNATLDVTTVKNAGSFTVSGASDLSGSFTGNAISFAEGTVLTSTNGVSFEADHSVSKAMTFGQGDFDFQKSLMGYGKFTFAEGADVSAAATLAFYAGAEVADGATVSANSIYANGGDVTVYGDVIAKGGDGGLWLRSGKSFNVIGGNVDAAYIEGTRGTVSVNLKDATVAGRHHISENGGTLNWNIANSSVTGRDWTSKGAIVLADKSSIALTGSLTTTGTITITDSTLTAQSIVNNGTINLTVTDAALADIYGEAYTIINQTGKGAALDLKVSYNGAAYGVGESFTVNGIQYSVVNGDGNDIAIQAQAKTVVLDSTITSNGFNKFAQAGEFFEMHDSYDERIQGNPEKIVVNGSNVLDTSKSKYYVYSDSDLSISGGTLDVSNAGRFYFMDTVAPNGTAAADADFSNIATVTIEEGATLKGYINLGQAIDNGDDIDDNGNVTRDGGAMNMIVKGTLDHKNLYVNTGSTLTVTETGKVTQYATGGDNHIRSGAKVVVNGTCKDGDVQFKSNWWSIRGGEMEFNNTNAETGTLRLNADADNALVTGDTTASLTVNNSRLNAYAIEVDNADSSFTAKDSIIETTLLENAGTFTVTGDSSIKTNKLTSSQLIAFGDMDADRTKLSLGSASGNGMTINSKRINLYNTDVTLTDNINAELGNDFLYFKEAKLNLNGNNLSLNTGKMILNGIDINGTGTINAIDSNDPVCVQNLTANIGEGVTFNAHTFHAYADTNVAGNLNVTNTILVGVDGKDPADNKTPWIDNADMTVTGSLTTNNMEVRGVKGEVVASKLIVDGGEVNVTGTLTNKGEMTVSNGTLIANKVVTGGTINSEGEIQREDGDILVSGKSSVQIANLQTGNVYIADGAELNNSYINNTDTTTVARTVLLGSATFNGGFSTEALYTDWYLSDGGTITIDGTVTVSRVVSLGAAPGNDFVLNGGKIVMASDTVTAKDDKVYSFTVAYGTVTLNTDIEVNGAGDEDGAPIQFQMADVYINSTITQLDQTHSGNVVRVQNSNVYLNATGVINSNVTVTTPWASWNGHDRGVLTLAGGTINGNVNVDSKSELNLTDKGGVVTGTITATNLTLDAGDILTVGALDVDNLNLTIGSSLTVTGTDSVIGTITIVGELVPSNAEFTLVTSGWNSLGETSVMYKGTEYTVADSIAGLSGLNFVTIDGNLYVKNFGAATSGIYINKDIAELELADGTKITADDGATYTVGVDAFASASAAASALDGNAGKVNSIVVDAGEVVEDTAQATFGDELVINNAGHLNANIVAGSTMEITNSSVNTLLGSYTADYEINVNNAGGMIGDAAGAATVFNTGYLTVVGGDAANVTVNGYALELTDTNSFGLNADSGVLALTDGNIYLNGSANMSIDGNTTSNAFITGDNHTGTLTLNGQQTFTGDMSANKIVVAGGKEVTFQNNTVDFNDLTIDGILNADFTKMNSYTDAGSINGEGTLNTTHTGAWIINDSVNRDLSGFAGTVTMTQAGASMVMGKGDAVDSLAAADSYFADGTTVVVNGNQQATLAGDGIATGIKFSGNGTLNVGNYDGGFVDGSNDFTQTLTGNNAGFTGKVNVSEGAQLTIENALGAAEINMNYNGNANATGAADDTQLNLNKDGLDLGSKITGDANDVINVMQNATLSGSSALNSFEGTVSVNANTLTLGGENVTDAKFTGTGTINTSVAGANQTLNADGALDGFNGKLSMGANTLTLGGVNDTAAKFSSSNQAGTINVNADQTFSATSALVGFSGTINLGNNKLTLGGQNYSTGAKFNGTGSIDASTAGANQTFTAGGALNGFSGTIDMGANTLNLSGINTTDAQFKGTGELNANAPRITETFTADGALDNFSGKVNLVSNTLNLNGVNDTAATFSANNGTINANANQTFSADGALDGFKGTVAVGANTLTLTGDNTTAAKITGTGTITAGVDANGNGTAQVFTGNVTGFDGTYDIATGSSVTLSGTIANTINAKGDTLNLSNASGIDVTVNAGTNNSLTNLNFGSNGLTLGTGDFTNVNGTGDINAFGEDKSFSTVSASNIFVAGDNLTITDALQAVVNLTINGNSDAYADVTYSGTAKWDDEIKVVIANDFTGAYALVKSDNGYTITQINLTIGSESANIGIGDAAQIGDYTYRLINDNNTLKLDKMSLFSNFVVINADWTGSPYQQVSDNGTIRNIGYDAAGTLDNAVDYIKGYNKGTGWIENGNPVETTGGAKMELTAGKHTLSAGKTLMTTANEVTNLTVSGRNGEKAVLSGAINGSDGSKATTLTLENVTIQGEVYGGGKLVIQNGADDRATGNVIAAGINNTAATATMANASELVINGGNFGTRSLVGGSVNSGTGTLTVDGATSLVIDNTSGEKLVISSNIYGGSWAESGKVVQNGNANITINAEQETQIRGNIYVSGGAANGGVLEMNGNSTITFTGDASKLTFTGSVNAVDGDRTTETIVFKDFAGTFNGSINGFDTIAIVGGTQLSLGRRQTQTGDTAVSFTVTADTQAGKAMYTVRDKNSWEFAKVISVDATAAGTGEYILVDNYAGGYEGFTFTLNGQDYTLGSVVNSSIITVVDDKLVLSVYDSNTNIVGSSTEQVVIDSQSAAETLIVGNVTSNSEGATVEVAKENAIVTNNGAIGAADITSESENAVKSAAVEVSANGTKLVNEGTIAAADAEYSVGVSVLPATSGTTITNAGTITGGDAKNSKAIQIGTEGKKTAQNVAIVNDGDIISNDITYYNSAVYSYSKDFSMVNNGTIIGDIRTQGIGAGGVSVENNGTVTAVPTSQGSNSVVSTDNGMITFTGDNGTYELAVNPDSGKFTGEIVEGKHGIRVIANNATFKAGNDITVGTGTLKGFTINSGKHIEISGNGNRIELVTKKSAYGIDDQSYDAGGTASNVVISGNDNTISVTSASDAHAIFSRNGAIIITGSGTTISAASTGSYAYGIETKDVKNYSGDVIIGTFNDDGSVAQASDIQLTVSGASSSTTGILAAKGNVQVALAADGKIESSHIAISAESIQISNAGTIIGDVKATGTGSNDSITIGVDAVLNGKISGVETLSVTGISSLTTDVAGAKAVTGSVDGALANVKLDNVDSVLGTAKQIAGTATTETDDDVWASLDKLDNGNLVVAWGRSEAEVGAAFDAFKADSTLAIGDALVADVASLADGANVADFDAKKTNGNLA